MLRKLYDLLTTAELLHLGGIFVLTVIVALFEVAGVASVMPFMGVLANPDIVQENKWLSLAFAELGFTDIGAFNFLLGGVVLTLLVASMAAR